MARQYKISAYDTKLDLKGILAGYGLTLVSTKQKNENNKVLYTVKRKHGKAFDAFFSDTLTGCRDSFNHEFIETLIECERLYRFIEVYRVVHINIEQTGERMFDEPSDVKSLAQAELFTYLKRLVFLMKDVDFNQAGNYIDFIRVDAFSNAPAESKGIQDFKHFG